MKPSSSTRIGVVVAVALTATVMPTTADARSVAEFLSIAEPLRAKGIMGTYSADFRQLNAEGDAALAKRFKAVPTAKPKVCATQDATNMSVDGFQNLLRAIPASQRAKISLENAVNRVVDGKHRCR